MGDPSNGARLGAILADLGFGPDPEMLGTGDRVVEWLSDWVPDNVAPHPTLIPSSSRSTVSLHGIQFYSLCAHHLLPFMGTVDLAYAPLGQIAGLGWFGRIVRHTAHRPQLQERLAEELADAIESALHPRGLRVRVVARHLCVELRGTAAPEVEVVVVRGETLQS